MKSLVGHTFLPYAVSVVLDYAFTVSDAIILAFMALLFALYQYVVDYMYLRDKPPSFEYAEFTIYIVAYSVVGLMIGGAS